MYKTSSMKISAAAKMPAKILREKGIPPREHVKNLSQKYARTLVTFCREMIWILLLLITAISFAFILALLQAIFGY